MGKIWADSGRSSPLDMRSTVRWRALNSLKCARPLIRESGTQRIETSSSRSHVPSLSLIPARPRNTWKGRRPLTSLSSTWRSPRLSARSSTCAACVLPHGVWRRAKPARIKIRITLTISASHPAPRNAIFFGSMLSSRLKALSQAQIEFKIVVEIPAVKGKSNIDSQWPNSSKVAQPHACSPQHTFLTKIRVGGIESGAPV